MDVGVQRVGCGIQRWLWLETHWTAVYFLALLMAGGMIFYLYPLSFLAGKGAFFEGGDASQNVSGWLFFRQDSWHFPILKTDWLSYPQGVSIAFTDSIPLLALPLKLFATVLPEDFHYFGIWHAISFVLQGVGAVFLIRSLGVRHLPGALLATAFALCWPALTFRFGHTALMSQWLLLFALGVYFRGCVSGSLPGRFCAQMIGISTIALLIHPYLLAMAYPLLLVYLVRQWRAGIIDIAWAAKWLAGSIGILLVIILLGGYFIGKSTAAGGYGVFSLNLLAPFCGGIICAFVDGTGGQPEGFNYFGAGLLALFAIVLFTDPKALPSAISRHRYLFIFLLLLTLFALSSKVYLGKLAILNIDLPRLLQGAFGIFRASGRFFWLVGYCVLFFVLAVLLRKRSPAVLMLVVLALFGQWVDTRGWRHGLMEQIRKPSAINMDAWKTALGGVEHLALYPTYGCGKATDDVYAHYQYIAARAGLRINTGYTARQAVDCSKGDFASQPPQENHVYIHLDFIKNPFDLPPLYRDALQKGECGLAGAQLLCQPNRDQILWAGLVTPVDPGQIEFSQYWTAESLPSVIGRLEQGLLVPQQPGAAGYLSYGPYLNISAGMYSFKIDYLSSAQRSVVAGEWDVVGEISGQMKTLARGPLHGSDSQLTHINSSIVAEGDIKRLEIRLFSRGEDIRLSGIGLFAGLNNKDYLTDDQIHE